MRAFLSRGLFLIGAGAYAVLHTALAQPSLVVTGGPELLVEGRAEVFVQPRWSPDGRRIAFTTEAYRGLWISDSDGQNPEQVTDERSAGFGFAWSPDGSAIVARVARYEGFRRFDALKLFEVVDGRQRLLTEYRRDMPSLPAWTADGGHVLLSRRQTLDVIAADPSAGKTVAEEPVLLARGTRFVLGQPARRWQSVVSNAPDGDVINLVTSPDGRLAAFEVVGGNLYVTATDGSHFVDLGPGHRPQWSPDSQWIAFMRTEDDGHVLTASDLFATTADGSTTVRLTDTRGSLEMNPSWSPDGSRIAYDDGRSIYTISVSAR